MSRRRYLSTEISTDTAVNKLAMRGSDFAALLYTWMIPHAADDATINGDPEELLMIVMPGRRDKSPEDIADALTLMEDLELIVWDRDRKIVNFPAPAFYKHQSYIKDGERRGANNTAKQRTEPQNNDDSANQRKSAQNDASLSFKSSSSFSSPLTPPSVEENEPPDPPRETFPVEFLDFWERYPTGHGSRSKSYQAWRKVKAEHAAIMAGLDAWLISERWQKGMVKTAELWLRDRLWENPAPPGLVLVNGQRDWSEAEANAAVAAFKAGATL